MSDQDKYILKFPRDDYEPSDKGLGWELFYCMKSNPDKVAQYISDTNEIDTYGALLERSVRTALKLCEKGLKPGDVVSLCSYNHRDTVVPILSSLFTGLIFSPLDPLLSQDQILHLLNITQPKIIFTIPESVDLLEKALEQTDLSTDLVVFGQTDKHEEFSSYLQPEDNEQNFEPTLVGSLKDTTLIYFSSGSTGPPKGVCLNHYAILAQAVNVIKVEKMGSFKLSNYTYQIDEQTVAWTLSPFYWVSAPLYFFSCIIASVPRVVSKSFNPETFWSIVEKYQVTNMFWSAVMTLKLSNICEGLPVQKTCLKSVMIGGSKLPDHVFEKLRKIYPTVFIRSGYAMTETSGPICLEPYDEKNLNLDPNNYGLVRGDFQVKIVDPASGKTLPPTQPGELRLKSSYLMNGYHKINPDGVYDEDGFFCTGDIVRFDEDNNLYYVERLKELIKYRGYHVSPGIIENVLQAIPEVERGAVIGIFDQEDDEHPKAYVQLKKGAVITAEQIAEIVNEQVGDSHKLRGGVDIIDNIPLTPSDKVNRGALRNLFNKNL